MSRTNMTNSVNNTTRIISANKTIQASHNKALSDLANFIGKTASPDKGHAKFWRAYKSASSTNAKRTQPVRASDLLGKVLAISARTRRIVAPKATVELDVFSPDGKRAVQLIMGQYS